MLRKDEIVIINHLLVEKSVSHSFKSFRHLVVKNCKLLEASSLDSNQLFKIFLQYVSNKCMFKITLNPLPRMFFRKAEALIFSQSEAHLLTTTIFRKLLKN